MQGFHFYVAHPFPGGTSTRGSVIRYVSRHPLRMGRGQEPVEPKRHTARRNQMAKKLSASSRLGKQIRVTAESIWNKPLTERQKAALDGVARRQKRADVSQLDYSDIPKLTD